MRAEGPGREVEDLKYVYTGSLDDWRQYNVQRVR